MASGLPMGAAALSANCSRPPASDSVQVVQPTTASVGPYSLTKAAWGSSSRFHFVSSAAPSCSPPTTMMWPAVPTCAGRTTYCNASKCAGVSLKSSAGSEPKSLCARRDIVCSSSGSNSTCLPATSGASSVVSVASKPSGELTTEPSTPSVR